MVQAADRTTVLPDYFKTLLDKWGQRYVKKIEIIKSLGQYSQFMIMSRAQLKSIQSNAITIMVR